MENDKDPIKDTSVHYNVRNELQHLSADEIKDIYLKNVSPIEVACLNLGSNLNIGNLVRTASLFAVRRIHVIGRKQYDRRGAVGMQNYLPIEFHRLVTPGDELDLEAVRALFREWSCHHQIILLEQTPTSVSLIRMKAHLSGKPPLFVVGSESFGIPTSLFEDGYLCVEIPQSGVGRSHNVSSAFAMVLWEYFRTELP